MTFVHQLQSNQILFIICIGILGLAIGSFLNVIIYRLPIMLKEQWQQECAEFLQQPIDTNKKNKINLAFPRSYCPYCKHKLSWKHNIPLFSFLILGGKCKYCTHKIPLHYPIVEVLSSILAMLVAYRFGYSWTTLFVILLTWPLLALTFIDFENFILPDVITLPLLWIGLLINCFNIFTSPVNAIWGAATGYTFLWIIAFLFKTIRRIEGMGYGDFKLLALFGAWLGWRSLPIIILISSLLGIAVGLLLWATKKRSLRKPLPFGPYLAIAGWLIMIIGWS